MSACTYEIDHWMPPKVMACSTGKLMNRLTAKFMDLLTAKLVNRLTAKPMVVNLFKLHLTKLKYLTRSI